MKHVEGIWPVDLDSQREILNLVASNGNDAAPMKLFCDLIYRILGFDKECKPFRREAVAAAHLITSIVSSTWQKQNNYSEVIKLYVLLYAAVCSYADRANVSSNKIAPALEEIEFNILETLAEFAEWVASAYPRRPLVDNIFEEFTYFHIRKRLLMGIFSAAALERSLSLSDAAEKFIWHLICRSRSQYFLAGEFIVPACLAIFWAQSNIQGSNKPDRELGTLLANLVNMNSNPEVRKQAPSPYYALEDVVEWAYQEFLGVGFHDIDDDSNYRRSAFAEGLFYLLVRRNYKISCKYIWPDITRFAHVRVRLPARWQFGMVRSEEATQEDKQIRIPQTWTDVVTFAQTDSKPNAPTLLLANPVIMLLYCIYVPYRMDTDVMLWLDRQFCGAWY